VGTLLVEERRIRDCIERDELVLTTIHGKLARLGVVVPFGRCTRFATERCGFGARRPTVRVADGDLTRAAGIDLHTCVPQLG
jgi:hypothetical protein